MPRLLIATRVFGASGQPWMWRQVIGLDGFRKELVCWERQNAESQPTAGIEEHVLPGHQAPYNTSGRWLYRARAIFNGSFYAAIGDDRARLKHLLEQSRPDIILSHFGDIAMRLLPAAEAVGVPMVAYFHGDFTYVSNRWFRWSLYRCLHRFAAIIVVTPAEREWLLERGFPQERIHFIPCGAPTEIFRPAPPSQAPAPVRFVMVSRLAADKGCADSVTAFARVAAGLPEVTLDIYGDGEERQRLEELVRTLGIGPKVTFHGYVDELRLAELLPHHDIFIQQSRMREGSPVSIVEAMACGLPVIATPVGGIVEQVIPEKTGLLVGMGDVDAMTQAMLRLARDTALRRGFGKAARRHAVANHDASRQTARLSQLLKDVERDHRSGVNQRLRQVNRNQSQQV